MKIRFAQSILLIRPFTPSAKVCAISPQFVVSINVLIPLTIPSIAVLTSDVSLSQSRFGLPFSSLPKILLIPLAKLTASSSHLMFANVDAIVETIENNPRINVKIMLAQSIFLTSPLIPSANVCAIAPQSVVSRKMRIPSTIPLIVPLIPSVSLFQSRFGLPFSSLPKTLLIPSAKLFANAPQSIDARVVAIVNVIRKNPRTIVQTRLAQSTPVMISLIPSANVFAI